MKLMQYARFQVNPDLRDQTDPTDNLAPMVILDFQDQLDHLDILESLESVRSTVPSTEEYSSRTEHDVKCRSLPVLWHVLVLLAEARKESMNASFRTVCRQNTGEITKHLLFPREKAGNFHVEGFPVPKV